jgi:hypothetical protein
VREPLVAADGDVVAERYDADEPRGIGGSGREDRNAGEEGRRVGRDDLRVEALPEDGGDGGLAARGRAVEREDLRRRRRAP